ncbi:MAG: phosphotransferase enzyme family protein [Acholeplasmatales bacterium]
MENIIKHFNISGKLISISPHGDGHINRTFKVITTSKEYILQKINHHVFKDVEKLMSNIAYTTEFMKNYLDQSFIPLEIIKTTSGKNYLQYNDEYYRMYDFINEGVGYETIENVEQFYECGVGFGTFQQMLNAFDASKLYETIPNFHNTKVRLETFLETVKADKHNRAASVKNDIDFYLSHKHYANVIVDLIEAKKMPIKVTHNDTKLNNLLINFETNKSVAIVDFDTIMPGSIVYDFGDSIRFGANHSKEDEPDLSKVNFDIELFEAYTKGFLSKTANILTKIEIDHLAFGSILMTYECGMRFLTDYLDGDNYFKIYYPKQNLNRSRTQMKLVQDMKKILPKMEKIVDKYYKLFKK